MATSASHLSQPGRNTALHPELNKLHISYGAKKYAVTVTQLTTGGERDITSLRDWTAITQIALSYLEKELPNQTQQQFDFTRMRRAEISIRGALALTPSAAFSNPSSAAITQVAWEEKNSQQLAKRLSLSPPQSPEALTLLQQLANEMASYKGPQKPARQLATSSIPARSSLIHDAGGGGDCGPNSIAHQLSLMPQAARKTSQQLRNDVADYLSLESSMNDPLLFGYIVNALKEEREDFQNLGLRPFPGTASVSQDQIIADLLNVENTPPDLLPRELRNRIFTYRRERLKTQGSWVDKDFFYALGKLQLPIAIIKKLNDQYFIEERFPSNQPINKDNTIWIYYNGTRQSKGYHFQSFLRNNPEFNPWIDVLLLRDKTEAIETFCEHLIRNRERLASAQAEERDKAVPAMTHAVADLKNAHPELFAKTLHLMKQNNPDATFTETDFGNIPAHYEELLNPRYQQILTAQKLNEA